MHDSEPAQNQRRGSKRLRWACVLPGALLAGWLLEHPRAIFDAQIGLDRQGSGYSAFIVPVLQSLPSGIAFAVAGTVIAPGFRPATAIVLAALCIPISTGIHIFAQPDPGLTNYMHSTGESLGALLGVAGVLIGTALSDPRNDKPSTND
ncbi:MAG: hypothetical protein MK102_06895 [Fuerstiella sp.]|nr:hypothetical protein [Fuerstiella sp.]